MYIYILDLETNETRTILKMCANRTIIIIQDTPNDRMFFKSGYLRDEGKYAPKLLLENKPLDEDQMRRVEPVATTREFATFDEFDAYMTRLEDETATIKLDLINTRRTFAGDLKTPTYVLEEAVAAASTPEAAKRPRMPLELPVNAASSAGDDRRSHSRPSLHFRRTLRRVFNMRGSYPTLHPPGPVIVKFIVYTERGIVDFCIHTYMCPLQPVV